MKKHILIIMLALISGCAFKGSADVSNYGNIDAQNKTITVYTGNKDLNGEVKRELMKNGWTLKVSTDEESIEGSVGNKVSLRKYSYKTRYTMDLQYHKGDALQHWNGDIEPIFFYELSIFDNKTGDEVIGINGKDTQKNAAQSIVNAVEAITK